MGLFNKKSTEIIVTADAGVKEIDLAHLNKMGEDTRYTFDVADLERREKQFLFVPDEMMKNHWDHAHLGFGALKIASVFTQDHFSLWKRKLGPKTYVFPLRKGGTLDPLAPIRGELFLIRTQQLFKLDTHRRNGVEYKRERVKLILPFTEMVWKLGDHGYYIDNIPKVDRTLNAWMYIGVHDFWYPILDGGIDFAPVSRYEPNNNLFREFYYFTNKEYD